MTPIPRNLIVYNGITFTFYFILRNDLSQIATFTVDPTTDIVTTASAHGLAIGDPVQFVNTGGALPAPLQQNVDYFVISIPSSTTFTFSSNYAGLIFNVQAVGTGTNTVWTKTPLNLTGWSVWSYVRDKPSGTLILDLAPVVTPLIGKIDLSKTDDQTYTLSPGNFYWDIILEDTSGTRIGPLFAGSFQVVHLITDPAP